MMQQHSPARGAAAAAVLRLSRIAPLDDAAMTLLSGAFASAYRVKVRRELLTEGKPVDEPLLLLSGWAARVRVLADGRRQFLSFLLPGDLVGLCRQRAPLAASTVVALTDIIVCAAPPAMHGTALAEAYAMSAAIEEAHLLAQITRVGRLTAQERIGDLFLELHNRLSLAGLVTGGSFGFPLTQEVLADALGLTSVHVNRMLQVMRGAGDIEWKNGQLRLTEPAALASKLGHHPVRVAAL